MRPVGLRAPCHHRNPATSLISSKRCFLPLVPGEMQELAVRELVVEVSRYLVNASNQTRPASKWEKAFHFTARNLPTDNLTDCLSHAPTTRLNGEFQGLRIPKGRAITRYLSSDSLLSADDREPVACFVVKIKPSNPLSTHERRSIQRSTTLSTGVLWHANFPQYFHGLLAPSVRFTCHPRVIFYPREK